MPENRISRLFESSEETVNPEIAQINGSIPAYVQGNFIRTGPAKWDMGNFSMNHWLDGFAMLSKFNIDSESQMVSFEKKFLQSDAYRRGVAAQRPVITEFGTPSYPDPSKSFFSKMLSAVLPLELSDNNTGAIFQLGKEVFATSETCFFRSIDPCSLETGEKYDSNKCFGLNIDSAHPLTDDTGVTWNMGSTFLTGLKYNVVKIPPPASNQTAKEIMKKSKMVASISSSWNGLMSYNHQSFTITKNYIVFIEQPMVMNLKRAAQSILKGSPTLSEYLEWRPELKNRFFIISKETGKVMKTEFYAKDPFFYLHFINAYEENNQIVVDLNCYDNTNIFENLILENLRCGKFDNASQSTGHRFVVPLVELRDAPEGVDLVAVKSSATAIRTGSSITLTPEIMTDSGFENPVINNKYLGKPNAFFYASGTYGTSVFKNAITKFDNRRKETTVWRGTEFQFPGEPQIIPNPAGKTEDDAVLIAAVNDISPGANDFIVFIDTRTMEELGRAQFQTSLPVSFHGLFMAE